MQLKRQEIINALTNSPTRHWWAVQNEALNLILNSVTKRDGNLITVDDEAFRKAMTLCRSLPAGGRHVAEAYRSMWWCIDRARVKNENTN